MSKVVNLNRSRKKKEAKTKDEAAATNRANFGRTKGETVRQKMEMKARERTLDGHEIKNDPPPRK